MAVNKVIHKGTVLVDLTKDTVTPENLMNGVTAHAKNGEMITGTATGGGATTATVVGEGWVGTPLPTDGQIGTVYYNNNLSPQEVIDLITTTLNPNGEEFVVYCVAESQEYPDAESIIIQTGVIEGENVVTIFDSFVDVEADDVVEREIFMSGPEMIGFPFQGWNPTVVDFTFNFNVSNSAAYGEYNDQLSSLFSATPFTKGYETVQLEGEYDGSVVTATENGMFNIKTLLNKKKLPFAVDVQAEVEVQKDAWIGTEVPTTGSVENIYINYNLTIEEVRNIAALILPPEDLEEGTYSSRITIAQGENAELKFSIQYDNDRKNINSLNINANVDGKYYYLFDCYESMNGWSGGWNSNADPEYYTLPFSTDLIGPSEENPNIGAFNSQLSELFSITPFTLGKVKVTSLKGIYDGYNMDVTENGTIDIVNILEENKLPLQIKVTAAYEPFDERVKLQKHEPYLADYMIIDNYCYLSFFNMLDGYGLFYADLPPWKDVENIVVLNTTPNLTYNLFKDQSISSVTIPDSVISMGSDFFRNCQNLTEVKLPKKLNSMGDQFFSNCVKLKEVTLPEIPNLGYGSFDGCTNLEKVYIQSGIEEIGQNVFKNTPNLKEIVFGGTISEWNNIDLRDGWLDPDTTGDFVVYCTDGTIAKSEL